MMKFESRLQAAPHETTLPNALPGYLSILL